MAGEQVQSPPGVLRLPRGARIAVLTAVLALGALVLVAGVLPDVAVASAPLPWWALLPCFAAAEVLVVHVQYRRDDVLTVSFGEVPLVLGLVYAEPVGFVVANVLGSALGLLLHRKQRGLKLAFNVALLALEAAVAQAVFHTLLGEGPAHELGGLLAALATIALTDLVSAGAITAVIALDTGELDPGVMLESVTTGLLAALTNSSLALLVVVALRHEPGALLLLLPLLGVLLLCYRSYSVLSSGHLRLERLYRFTSGVGKAVPVEDVLRAVLEQARDVLAFAVSELVVPASDGRPGIHVRLDDEGLRELRRADDQHPDDWWAPALSGQSVVRRQDAVAGGTGLAAPLALEDGLLGVLLVTGLPAHLEAVGEDEVPLMASLANHAAVALQNARLVDRLRAEAADKQHQALHDGLTGLLNRRGLAERVHAELEAGRSCHVVVLGLDGFQDINEALGYDTGDLLLVEAGRRLHEQLPAAAAVARLGGDEFAVLLPTDGASASAAARACLVPLRAAFAVRGVDIDLRATTGVATAPEHADGASALLQRAEAAMYVAKRDGTGAEVFDPLTDHGSDRRLRLTTALRLAVAEGRLDVHYQPKVDPSRGTVVAAEALVRWSHPTLGPVSPEEFIPLAEYTGLIGPLTAHVLRSALAECRLWRDHGDPLTVAVNLSARSLSDRTLPAQVREALTAADLPASALTLEITESVVMTDPDRALLVLGELRALGVRLSVDDFGTGLSSLTYLKTLPVHEVKIDKSFVMAMIGNRGDRAIVHAAIRLVHDLGLTVVAEGVEDVATRDQLAAWDCDVVQGYLFSRPLPPDRFRAWLGRQQSPATAATVATSAASV